MKLEMKLVIGLLAVVALCLVVMVVRSGGPAQVQIVAPAEKPLTKADALNIVAKLEAMIAEEDAALKETEAKIAQREKALAEATDDVAREVAQGTLDYEKNEQKIHLTVKAELEARAIKARAVADGM